MKKIEKFEDYDEFEQAMKVLILAVEVWNAKRGLVHFDALFEARLLCEEMKEVAEAKTLAELMCELADCSFVLFGMLYKIKADKIELAHSPAEETADLVSNLISIYRDHLDISGQDFSTLYYHAFKTVITNNQLKPFNEKDENGKVVKGKNVGDPVEDFKPLCKALGYDPDIPVTAPEDVRKGVETFSFVFDEPIQ